MKRSLLVATMSSLALFSCCAFAADGDFSLGDMQDLEETLTIKGNFSKTQYLKIEQAITDQIIDSLEQKLELDRIIGGDQAGPSELPWMVALIARKSNGKLVQFCGATLIAKNKVLTAAHCYVVPEKAMFASIGRADITPPLTGLIAVSSIKPHPGYVTATSGNDLAVITLAQEVTTTPMPLASANPALPENKLSYGNIAGWGLTSEGGTPSQVLLKAEVPYVSAEQCRIPYPALPAKTLCAGFKTGGTDTCQGDSGGPLFSDTAVVGITSYGFGCARKGYYGVYTSVADFRDWIVAQ